MEEWKGHFSEHSPLLSMLISLNESLCKQKDP